MATASLELPISGAQEPGASFVAGLDTRELGVRLLWVQIRLVSKAAKKAKVQRNKIPIE